MTAQEALGIINHATGILKLNRAEHAQVETALKVLAGIILKKNKNKSE